MDILRNICKKNKIWICVSKLVTHYMHVCRPRAYPIVQLQYWFSFKWNQGKRKRNKRKGEVEANKKSPQFPIEMLARNDSKG